MSYFYNNKKNICNNNNNNDLKKNLLKIIEKTLTFENMLTYYLHFILYKKKKFI